MHPEPPPAQRQPHADTRPYLRIYFSCAKAYQRVYRQPDGSAYLARCPKCGLAKRFVVGQGGTGQRFFELSCR